MKNAALFIASTRTKYSTKELPIIGSHCFGYHSKKLRNAMAFPWHGYQAGISIIGIQSNGYPYYLNLIDNYLSEV